MSKSKKKRNKVYTGRDAAPTPTVHRYTAEVKSKPREWWDSHKRATKISAGVGGGVIIFGWLLFEFFRLILN
jgi:hypothetical protein